MKIILKMYKSKFKVIRTSTYLFSFSSISSAANLRKSPLIETHVKAPIKIMLDIATVTISNFDIPKAIANMVE